MVGEIPLLAATVLYKKRVVHEELPKLQKRWWEETMQPLTAKNSLAHNRF